MARFGLLGRLLLILFGALVVYGAGSLLLLRWEATHHTRPSPFLRVRQFAADIDVFAAAPPPLWPDLLRVLGTADIRVRIADRAPGLEGFIRAPRLEARLRGFARNPAAMAASVYTSVDQSNRSPADGVEGFMALATFPLADGRTLVAVPELPAPGRTVLWGLPFGLWIGLAGAAVSALAVGIAVRELRPLRELARSLERFDGRPVAAPRASGAPDVRALADAITAMQRRIALLLSERTLMVGAISHDLRTFLTRLQLRVMSLDDGALRARCVADLDAMGALIADALAYARGSDVGLAREPLDLADLVATEVAEREALGLAVPIETDLADAPVLGDRVALRRVAANLLDNAARFARSRLRVTVSAADGCVRFLVEDDGPGVPEAERSAVLLPYHRVDGSRSRETGGAGLGLAIAARIAEAHAGGIDIGVSEWGGALVAVCLPTSATARAFPHAAGAVANRIRIGSGGS